MIKKLLYAGLAAVLVVMAHAAFAQNLNQPGGQLNNLNLPSGFQGGTWTPTLSGVSTAGVFVYGDQAASYEIIGRSVFARFNVSTTSNTTTTAGSGLSIAGLPIAATSSTSDYGQCNVELFSGVTNTSGYTQLAGVITPGTKTVALYEVGSGQALRLLTGNQVDSTTFRLQGFCNYRNP